MLKKVCVRLSLQGQIKVDMTFMLNCTIRSAEGIAVNKLCFFCLSMLLLSEPND